MFLKTSCHMISTTFLLILIYVCPLDTIHIEEIRSDCCIESSANHFICQGSCQFPQFTPDATEVSVVGGYFAHIDSHHFPGTVQTILIIGSTIDDIDSHAFYKLRNLVHIEFYKTQITRIREDAFTDLVFKSPLVNITTEATLSFIFNQSTIREIEENGVHDINDVEFFQFIDVVVRTANHRAFYKIGMKDGVIELTRVEVVDDAGAINLEFFKGVTETRIRGLSQNMLSSGLLNRDGQTHSMVYSSFVDIDEDLAGRSYNEDVLIWGQVDIYCGEDIEWLIVDKSSIPGEMLNSLHCNGPQSLEGQRVSELTEDYWRDKVFPDDSLSPLLIIIIIGCAIIAISVIIGIVICICRRKQEKPASNGIPVVKPEDVIVPSERNQTIDTDPFPHHNLEQGIYPRLYQNPTAPPYDNLPEAAVASTSYHNPSGATVPSIS